MSQVIYLSEATAARRRVYIRLVLASDGTTPATSTDVTAGKARLMSNGTDGGDSTNNIVQIDGTDLPGEWYVELETAELTTLGVGRHRARFKEADTLESIGGYFDITPDNVWVAASSAAAIADAVWDEARAGHVAAGSFGEGVVVNSLAAGSVTATAVATGVIDADALAADAGTEIANAVLDLANGIETGYTPRQALRIIAAAVAGKTSSNGNTFRNLADSKARITATTDASGNRTAVTHDGT